MITFQYPYSTPTDTLTFKNPVKGNNEMLNAHILIQKSMSGVVYSYRGRDTVSQMLFNFRGITEPATVKQFFIDTAGSLLRMTDWEGTVWQVKVLNNPIEITQVSACDYHLTLQLEGTRV